MNRDLLSLWDYGWCDLNQINIPQVQTPDELVREYLCSGSFGTSFIGPELDSSSEIHGPFLRSKILECDFELISPQRFQTEVSSLRQPQGFPTQVPGDQWQEVENRVSGLIDRNTWFLMLRLNEFSTDQFHDSGCVLELFREFCCAKPDCNKIERLVFGYD